MDQYDFDPSDSKDGIAPRSYHEAIPQLLREMPHLIHNLSSYNNDENNTDLCNTRSSYQYAKPEKNKKCQVCGKHARTPSDLLRHMRVHTGERPFLCVACDKTFKCKRSQLTHQYLSHGIRDGLSDHRLDVLDHRKVKRNTSSSSKLKSNFCNQVPTIIDKIMHNSFMKQQLELHTSPQQPTTVDQDEDTEIVAGEEISSMSDGPVSFVGLFNGQPLEVPPPPQAEVKEEPPHQEEEQQQDKSEPQQQQQENEESPKKNKKKDLSRKVPILRIKTHKCTHCKRQFRSIYTLRYHLRSMHDEKVYLSPALESRLKKRRWIPPHVRLQKSKITSSAFRKVNHHKEKATDKPPSDNKKAEEKKMDFSALEIKKEKIMDGYEDDINNNIDKGRDAFFNSNNQPTSTTSTSFLPTSTSNPFVLPPHIFFPSAAEEGLEKPISWESLQATSEGVLISKLEAVHPGTQQKYVLYKCGPCGKAFASLRAVCGHLALNHDTSKERDCEKCGASFNWRQDLDTHLECHQATDRKFVPPPTSPFLPSYYVNPFPIPVVTPSEQTRLLPYPFFPMPQQLPQLMQPGFFPFFAAALQPQMQQQPPQEDPDPPPTAPPEEDKGQSFQCKLCPKTFDRIFSLQRHERIHSGVKACFCKTCGRGFSELRNLRHHIIRFHAESAQKEPLPYRRRPNRNVSSSQKLVSFLKKTAVRILNSVGQKEGDSGGKIQAEEERIDAEKEPQTSVTAEPEQNAVAMPKLFDATRLSPSQDTTTEVPPPKLSPGAPEDVPSAAVGKGAVEVLQDPKRSLLGNRRKGRPFKLNTMTSAINLSEDLLFPLTDPNFLEKHAEAISESSLLQATEILNGCLKPELAFPQLSYFSMDPSPNEPIDMRNPSAKEKQHEAVVPKKEVEDPPPPPAFPSDNNLALNLYNDPTQSTSLKLPESFESRCLFPCSYCHKSFNSITDINRHMSFHAGRKLSSAESVVSNKRSAGQTIADPDDEDDIRPFKCPYCSYCSRTNSQLKVHMMRHEGIKHYMCQICNYNGVTQSDLNRHLKTRTHLLRSRNVCACCGTGFHTRSLSDEHFKSCHMGSAAAAAATESKPPPAAAATTTKPEKASSQRSRVTRLKQFRQSPEEKAKSEFYQKLCDLNSMGLALGDFLQQQQRVLGEK